MSDLPSLPLGYEFHHIGCATASMERERNLFEFLGYKLEGESFIDPIQGIEGCFLTGPGPRIELLQNLPGKDTLTPWLNNGVKMYHFAYMVEDIMAALAWANSQRAIVVVQPVASIAFGGRRISFIMFRTELMIEFIEKVTASAT